MTIRYDDLAKLNAPFEQEFTSRFREVMNKGQFILGEQVQQLEREFSNYSGAAHCVCLGSGFDALFLALKCFGFKPGSEVIVPSNTYIATIMAVVHAGLKPVLVEPDPSRYTIDPNRLENAISNRTVAVMPVHLYGNSCPMDALLTICRKHGLRVIEDCAQSHGAAYGGKKTGTFGDIGAFSFYPSKNLGSLGDGGCALTNDPEIDSRLRALRNYGSPAKHINLYPGVNSRLDEIQAGFLRIKLKALDELNEHRRRNASRYQEGLSGDFVKPSAAPDAFDVFHIYPIRHHQRDALRSHLLSYGIETWIHYPVPPHRQPAFEDMFRGMTFPLSEEIHSTIVSLPISPIHSLDDIDRVIEYTNRFGG